MEIIPSRRPRSRSARSVANASGLGTRRERIRSRRRFRAGWKSATPRPAQIDVEAGVDRPGVPGEVVRFPGNAEALRVGADRPRSLRQEALVVLGRRVVDQRSVQIEDDGPGRHLATMHVRRDPAPILMTYAIVKLGGKQYRVQEGEQLLVDRLAVDENKTFHPEVLFVGGDGQAELSPKGVAGHRAGSSATSSARRS